MIRILIAWLFALCSPRAATLAQGELATAPHDITPVAARQHAVAALVAGDVYRVDPALLLSIAWHESRYQSRVVTPEVGGRVSCGVMTPEPRETCPAPSLLGGYLAGARHLRGWYDACRGNERCALTGYAGGWRLIEICESEPDLRACHTWEVFLGRARAIARRTRHAS